jgi:membrane associated rhomboid family serine protease
MLPIRDNIPASRFPVVTLGIIIINAVVFLKELALGPHLEGMILNFGIVPARYTHPEIAHYFDFPALGSIFTSMFLHGGWMHLLSNMWVLWIFGDNVEDRLGRARYLLFYLAAGVAAALLHIFTNLGSTVPTIGASGAIAGVMGSYFRFYPWAKVETLIPPFFFFDLPAILFLGYWFLLQFFNGTASLHASGRGFGGVAWWAHVGGFIFGFAICLMIPQLKTPPRLAYQERF